ncbi:beta carbonic anhydrase clade D [Trichoderma parareesei]|uniref:Beta carbonic anhydrase clade D n=1 Tax=Trichoderma parareesei TaxID=858221 RepID=A0A2H2YX75_TRIPA|nr:beta carbonic anhydrase clade D [Trichoderma parareesei]
MSTPFEFQVLEANAKYDSTYRHSGLECLFLRKAVIVTCMDCRLDPESAYGFELGEVTIIRNAGASGRDAASLRLTQVLLIKHTRCGLLGVPEEVVHGIMKKNLGLTESKDVDDFGVLTFLELEKSTREEVEYLRNHPLAWKQWRVTGWIHDMDTELLRKIVE